MSIVTLENTKPASRQETFKPVYEIHQNFEVSFHYPVLFTHDIFNINSRVLAGLLTYQPQFVVVVIDDSVLLGHSHLKTGIEKYFNYHFPESQFISPLMNMPGGEKCKNNQYHIADIHNLFYQKAVDRHSIVIVIGGGAVLDTVGLATSTAHRGIRTIRLPTTVLAQNDAGVGVKNGINFQGRKNFLGTFAPPFAVINDFNFLSSLQARDLRAGIAEAVKVALIRDKVFFHWLYEHREALNRFETEAMEYMIIRCAELHLEHIRTSNDPFEMGSARPLDFGHWSAHKLETMTYNELRHGEAVAIGIALDSIYSHYVDLISLSALKIILQTLIDIGFSLYHPCMDQLDIRKALEEFREHLGGQLCISLLQSIGHGMETAQIHEAKMASALAYLKSHYGQN